MKNPRHSTVVFLIVLCSCQGTADKEKFQAELRSINLLRGDIALCAPEGARFGKVEFALSCLEKVREDFNLATALLHSFEYPEAEKVFAKVIDEDPDCLMAYWGVAMSNFHPLWAPPTRPELEKGAQIIALARTLESGSEKESDYLEAVASMFDDWDQLDHKARVLKFESAAESIYLKYPDDKEAAIFYALALRAAADPTDKTFAKQKKAGDILNSLFPKEPDHPGVAHYLIHAYDYPELAELALPAARKYASIAASSAHALHMPSHIFTRLGLWEESIHSNMNSMSAAKCYAESSGMQGHWDEELHGLDYLVYAYLQQAKDDLALQQLNYLNSMEAVFPVNGKDAYTFAAVPTRYALERKDWERAAALELKPADFPWDNFPWERSLVSFGRVIGAVHLKDADVARANLQTLQSNHAALVAAGKNYEASQVKVQVNAADAWIRWSEGRNEEAVKLMTDAAEMEDATEKHPVTPGEVIPARELLGDLYMEMRKYQEALDAYEENLKRHPGRYNGLYGAAVAARLSGDRKKSVEYFIKLQELATGSDGKRKSLQEAALFVKQNNTAAHL